MLALLLAACAPLDRDGDGFAADVDCDDRDPLVHPGSHAPEVPADGVDQDCDGVDACRDLDCDGWPDLVLARTQDEAGSYDVPSVVLYGDGARGWRAAELPAAGAMGAAIVDLDRDGYLEVILNQATSDGEERHVDSLVYWGTAAGPDPTAPLRLPTIGAADVEVGDLDGDGHPDLVFSNRYGGGEFSEEAYTQPSRIYWGSATGPDPAVVTELTTVGAARAALADLDGDGAVDLAFAAGTVFASESPVFRGLGGRRFEPWTALPSVFAEGVTAGDLDGDGHPELVLANWCGGTACDSAVYWGGADGPTGQALALPTQGAVDSAIADLDGDGHRDLVFAHSFGEGWSADVDSAVYWAATRAGPPPTAPCCAPPAPLPSPSPTWTATAPSTSPSPATTPPTASPRPPPSGGAAPSTAPPPPSRSPAPPASPPPGARPGAPPPPGARPLYISFRTGCQTGCQATIY